MPTGLFSRGIAEGYRDGLAQGRIDGYQEGFASGLAEGQSFGSKVAQSLYAPLLQILREEGNFATEEKDLFNSASMILLEVAAEISFKNEEDPDRASRIAALEGKVKVLHANFRRKFKILDHSSQSVNDNKLAF